MLSCAFLLLAVISTAYAETAVSPCTSAANANVPVPVHTDIHGCAGSPCILVKGTDAIMDFRFRINRYSKTLSPAVTAFLIGIPIEYPLPGDLNDACKSINNGYCPVERDEVLQYQLRMPIADEFPPITVWLEFSILDDFGPITCFRIQATVVNP